MSPPSGTAHTPEPTASAASPIDFSGPRESSPLYDDFVDRYLAGDWATLAADLAAREKEIAKLPAGNRADLTYIKQTIHECRPAWWEQVKLGKPVQFQQAVWGHPVGIAFTQAARPGMGKTGLLNGVILTQVSWTGDDFDSKNAMSLNYLGIDDRAPSKFVDSDGAGYVAWTIIGAASVLQQNADRLGKMNQDELAQFEAFGEFRGNLTAAYYGTPPVRRLALIQSTSAMHVDAPRAPELFAHRALAASLLIELRLHPEHFKSLNLTDDDFDWIPTGDNVEFNAAFRCIMSKLLEGRFTLSEDRLVRDIVKTLAEANQDSKSSHISLPNKLSMEFDPDKDAAERLERMKFFCIGTNPMKKSP
jgi:hypothetical protein